MGKARRKGRGSTLGWSLAAIALLALIGWILWKHAMPQKNGAGASAGTNRFDVSRATNLLHWLNTNLTVRGTTVPATNPVIIPPTNRAAPKTNLFSPPPPPPTVAKTNPPFTPTDVPPPPANERPVKTLLEAQIALARLAVSSGPIDGAVGSQTRSAIRAFQKENELPATGELDGSTRGILTIAEPIFTTYTVTAEDLARLHPIPDTWMGKSQVNSLDYESVLEMVAELHQSSHPFIRSLNPTVNWTNVAPNTVLKVPNVERAAPSQRAAFIRIQLAAKVLEAFDAETNLLCHFPCSIAARVEKRPAGKLVVTKAAANPNYTFDPDIFPESAEARRIDHKLIIPPGPNNPVGVAWISLDKPGYGIHGTPRPDQVGRTESHGCFRLANWNAEYLLKLVWQGLPVYVEP